MGNFENQLTTGEKIIYQTKLNWTEYVKGILFLIVGSFLILGDGMFGGFLLFIGLVLLGITFLKISSSEFVVTDQRVYIKVGIIKTIFLDTMLNKIEGIYVEQGIIGKMADSGTIIIKGTGGSKNLFSNINHPFEFRNAVSEQISKLQKTQSA